MTLEVIVDPAAERGKIRVHPADKDLMDRAALAIDNSTPSVSDYAAKIIDRLLKLMIYRDYNAVDDALRFLKRVDHPTLWLSDVVRKAMENLK